MPHYTLLSGTDTTTRTFICDGCCRRYKASQLHPSITETKFTVSVCSDSCVTLASARLTNKVLSQPHNSILKETFERSGFNMRDWNAFIDFLWYHKHKVEGTLEYVNK